MDKKKLEVAIEKAQNLLKFFTEKSEEKFEGIKMVDSQTLVDYPALEIGAEVQISTASGSATAGDGEYALVNGAKFTVKDGKIESIESQDDNSEAKMAAKPVEGSPEEEATESPEEEAAEDSQEDQKVQDLTDRVSQLEAAVKAIMQAVQAVPSKDQMSAFQAELKTVNDSILALAKVPTQMSADNRVEIKETEIEKYSRIAQAFGK